MKIDDDRKPTRNPCVRQCCLDEHDICLGCGRSLPEILAWQSYSEQQRQQITLAIARRREQVYGAGKPGSAGLTPPEDD